MDAEEKAGDERGGRAAAASEARETAEERLRLLLEASEILSSSIDLETTLKNLPRCLVPKLTDAVAIDLVDEDGTIRRIAAVSADPEQAELMKRLSELGPPDANAPNGVLAILARGAPILSPIIDDEELAKGARSPDHLAILRALHPKSGLIVPMRVREKSIGVLWLFTIGRRRPFDAQDLELAKDLGRRAALAIDNARLHREAERAIADRDAFLKLASHELKTPLTSLNLQVGALARAMRNEIVATNEKNAARAALAERQIARMSALVETMAEVSLAAGGRLALVKQRADLAAIARQVVERFTDDAARARIDITLDAPAPVFADVDVARIDHLVARLLGNAIKFGEGRPVHVTVAASPSGALLRVSDSGIGVAQKDHARIFERFERAVSDQHYGGLGVGLWIAQRIAEAHGGHISIESTPGKGSTFTCELPIAA